MKAVIQRVLSGGVSINGNPKKNIGKGLVVLFGVATDDTEDDVVFLAKKIANLRIFSDTNDKMNFSVCDVKGEVIVISQFTLFASTKKGNRPWFDAAAKPDLAIPLYEKFVKNLSENIGKEVVTGEFGASMLVDIQNDGPVTIIIDTKTD